MQTPQAKCLHLTHSLSQNSNRYRTFYTGATGCFSLFISNTLHLSKLFQLFNVVGIMRHPLFHISLTTTHLPPTCLRYYKPPPLEGILTSCKYIEYDSITIQFKCKSFVALLGLNSSSNNTLVCPTTALCSAALFCCIFSNSTPPEPQLPAMQNQDNKKLPADLHIESGFYASFTKRNSKLSDIY